MIRKKIMAFFLFLLVFGLFSASAQANGFLFVEIKSRPSSQSVCADNKAHWRVDGGIWKSCADNDAELSDGRHHVAFQQVPGWVTPLPTTQMIMPDTTTTVIVYYSAIEYYYYYSDIANTYFASSGFDTNGDGQPDVIDTGTTKLFAIKWPLKGTFRENNQNVEKDLYLHSYIGGVTAPLAYYPDVCWKLTKEGMDVLVGDGGTFGQPKAESALAFRRILYANSGINGLKAFYTDAAKLFPSQLPMLLKAEERFREALRVNPYYTDALNGLLETYYARAEGFTLIGNDHLANAYKQKFLPRLNEPKSINDLEVEGISNALTCYEVGFREFMKLFNPEFIGVGQVRQSNLDINAEWMFFSRRFTNPNNPYGAKVAFESLRGQTSAIGVSSYAINGKDDKDNDVFIGPLQGSPPQEIHIPPPGLSTTAESKVAAERKKILAQMRLSAIQEEWNTVDTPVKFQLPEPTSAFTYKDDTNFSLRFGVDIAAEKPIQKLGMVIEFDYTKADVVGVDFAGSAFPNNQGFIAPGGYYGGKQLVANQLLVKADNGSPVSGTGLTFVTVTFHIKKGAMGSFSVYASGSGQLLSGFKDVAILYRLAAAHVNATAERIRRLYDVGDQKSIEQNIALIEKEAGHIGSWFETIQGLLSQAATPAELSKIDQLQGAINQVSSELNGLNNLREFIRAGANKYGYRDDYVPFYNSGVETFDAIKNMVVGSGAFDPSTAQGFFGTARGAETDAVLTKDKFEDTKDRIRSELFTINDQLETRLAQIAGMVDKNGNPGGGNDDIDYDLRAAPRNIACEIGQHALLLQRANAVIEQAQADIKQHLEDIEIEIKYLDAAVKKKEEIPGILDQNSTAQQNLTREIAVVQADQVRANAVTQAFSTIASKGGWDSAITGGAFSAAVAAGVQLANGIYQGDMERRKGELQAKKEGLAAQERIELIGIDTELFKLQELKDIAKSVNDIAVKNITAQIAVIDMTVALGQLNQLIAERDQLLARRNRQIANLGEMSFADPSFRLTQCNAMKEAETQLEFLKGWLYLMTRSLYYRWALPEGMKIQVGNFQQISINDINRIHVVGAPAVGIIPLGDKLTASGYVQSLLAFNDSFPIDNATSLKKMDSLSDKTARYSIREDFLHIVRTDNTVQERKRINDAFRAWLKSPDRRNANGDLVIAFDTMGNLEDYDMVVNKNHGTWTNFALRSYSTKPLWNHKITNVGVALDANGNALNGVNQIKGSVEYGGAGFVKSDQWVGGSYLAFQMKQWVKPPTGGLRPIDVRTFDVDIVPSGSFTREKMSAELKERPVTATVWRLIILKQNVDKIYLDNIDDIWIYIDSEAYQGQL